MLLLSDVKKKEIFTQLKIDPEQNFKILKPLGEGAYGAVFKALDRRDNQLVALKVMRFDPDECVDLLSEIKILRNCNNPYIVNFKDTFHKDGNIWLAMEYCEGGSTLDIIRVTKHTLSERQCQCVLYQAICGLAYLHLKGLIHRDIKAANILINKLGQCKLADFGVAKTLRASGAGTTIGSPYWMAPEVLGSEKYDMSADIWSLGIVAIEMAIGKPPLSNYKPLQAMFMIPKNDPPTIPEDYIDDFSDGFIQFIAKCLQKNPQKRLTAKQLLQDKWLNHNLNPLNPNNELIPWITKSIPLIEKDRDLKAIIANQDQSFDDSKWSDYTASIRNASHCSQSSFFAGATMVKNGVGNNIRDSLNGTLKVVHDDIEDDDKGNNDDDNSGSVIQNNTLTLTNNNTLTATNSNTLSNTNTINTNTMTRTVNSNDNDNDNSTSDDPFAGGTLIRKPSVQTITADPQIMNDNANDADADDDDDYHDNPKDVATTPSSKDTAITITTTTTTTTTTTNAANKPSKRKKRSRMGGGYSIGSKRTMASGLFSFDDNTMIRQTSTDDEEEDPYQGQTIHRPPSIDSPRHIGINPLFDHSDEEDTDDDDDDDDDSDASVIRTVNEFDNSTVTSMNTTKPMLSVNTVEDRVSVNNNNNKVAGDNNLLSINKPHPQAQPHKPTGNDKINAITPVESIMSDDEENVYELARGYENKPRSPASQLTKTPMGLAQQQSHKVDLIKLDNNGRSTIDMGVVGGGASGNGNATGHKTVNTQSSSSTPKPGNDKGNKSPVHNNNQRRKSKTFAERKETLSRTALNNNTNTKSLLTSNGGSIGLAGHDINPKSDGVVSVKSSRKSSRSTRGLSQTHNPKDDIPTSPIPHYKHMQILMDDNINSIEATTNINNMTTPINGNKITASGVSDEDISILANGLNFANLVNEITCNEHLLLIIGCISTWCFIISYITLEFSVLKRPREIQLFTISSSIAIFFNLILNPFYFKQFASKYIPSSTAQLLEITQPISTNPHNIHLKIRNNINDDDADSSDSGDSEDSDSNIKMHHVLNKSNLSNDINVPKKCIFETLIWMLRITALVCAICFAFFIYSDLTSKPKIYSNKTRCHIVLLTITLFVGNLPLMGHYLLYYRNTFFLYYIILWIITFSCEFTYFHFVRHVTENYFASFILINITFFIFHLLSVIWSSMVLKHRTLWEIDPSFFPNSNHYRVYINFGDPKSESLIIPYKTRSKPYRTVLCCCNKLICDSNTLLRFQSYSTAVSFWSFLGVMYTIGFEYVIIPSSIFMLVNTIWNPLFYSKTVSEIRGKMKCFCTYQKWFYYIMLFIAYIIGLCANIAWFSFSTSAFILGDDREIKYSIIINIVIFMFTTLVYYLPSIGYSFYRIPISYGISNIFGALFCFFIPLCISYKPHIQTNNAEDWFFIYNYNENNKEYNSNYLGFIVSAVIIALFLSFSGLSCIIYRIRKALVESSENTLFLKEFAMNMIMFWSFLLSFAVLTTNSLWVFGDNFGNNPQNDSISIISKIIYIITLFVQSSSLIYAIFTLQSRFDSDPNLKSYLSSLTDKVKKNCGYCCLVVLFPIIYSTYLMFMILISLSLGVTKLLSIRQVREFWLSFFIADFNPYNYNDNIPKYKKPNMKSINTNSNNKNHQVINIEVSQLNNKQIGINDSPKRKEIRRRMSSAALSSVNMKIYRCCECWTPRWMSSLYINESVYNSYLMSELIVESLPLLLLNLVNMFFNNRITTISIVSAVISGIFLLYTLAKMIYYVGYRDWNLSKFLP